MRPPWSWAQYESKVFHKILTSMRMEGGWMHLFNEEMNFVFLSGLRAYLHSHPTNTNGNDVVCADYGLNSARACYLRCAIIRPVLQRNGVDFFDRTFRITLQSYHATIKIILMYLEGSAVGVIRPLPSLPLLRRYGHCWASMNPSMVYCEHRWRLPDSWYRFSMPVWKSRNMKLVSADIVMTVSTPMDTSF